MFPSRTAGSGPTLPSAFRRAALRGVSVQAIATLWMGQSVAIGCSDQDVAEPSSSASAPSDGSGASGGGGADAGGSGSAGTNAWSCLGSVTWPAPSKSAATVTVLFTTFKSMEEARKGGGSMRDKVDGVYLEGDVLSLIHI